MLDDLRVGLRFLGTLPAFLRHPVTPREARTIVRRRLEERARDLLVLVRASTTELPHGPYAQLLRAARCEYGDIEQLVDREGTDGALRTLARAGVYLTLDEFKGRQPIVRGGETFTTDPIRLRNPRSSAHVPLATGGSRGTATPVLTDFAFLRDMGVNTCLLLEAVGGFEWVRAHWDVPGTGVLGKMLELAAAGVRPARWFSYIDLGAPGVDRRYRWSTRAVRWGSRLAGRPIPGVRYVPVADPVPIARWMRSILDEGRTPHVLTYTSPAVRLSLAALDAGIDLAGAHVWVGGEPLTPARFASIRKSGASVRPRYYTAECGPIGAGCLAPEAPDDLHVYSDFIALIQPDGLESVFPPGALLVSSLRPSAPFLLLNVSTGDQAELTARSCGCALERRGWTTHLRTVRSYEKVTAGGMTFLDARVIEVLEEVLPARFGGGPTDYQLVEDEGGDGKPRLRLLVHPRLGPVDVDDLERAFLGALGDGTGPERVMGLAWGASVGFHVERRVPLATPKGKIQHIHSGPATLPP